jgi:predicted nucleic-acid-binding Zn-ribbon protein
MGEVKKCPKCGGEMESGVIKGYMAPVWFESAEVKGMLGFGKNSAVIVYSCKLCGYIEMYRHPRSLPKTGN